ncbi:MAG: TonB-dependent receptor, partial [Tannerellaceae bacterium]|nr:TonB-dependent receptor [Tannerellaceae bacterium]
EQIKEQSGYSFSLDVKDLNLEEKITISAQSQDIDEIMALLLKGKNLSYEIIENHIVITPIPIKTVSQQSRKRISGTVTDEYGESVIGANVFVKGTTDGTITDVNGSFTLEVPENGILQVTYIGYLAQEIRINNQQVYHITLTEDTQKLDEVVVVGFGTQKKLNLTGAVSAVSGDNLVKRPVSNTATLLQGQIPGLRVNVGGGTPGDEQTSFRVCGQGTYSSAGSDPMVLINGVPGSMTNLDPNMIESVSVLKDAAPASIYGARAANGVILITTKQGVGPGQKPTVRYHGNIGFHSPTKMYDLVTNSVDYMTYANMAKDNSGNSNKYSDEIIDLYRRNGGSEQYPNFDWIDYMFNTATVQTHNISVAGSADRTTYNLSLNYINQPGVMRGFDYQKYNITLDLTSQVTDFIRIGTFSSMMYSQREQPRQGQEDSFLSTLSQAPTYMPWLPDDGSGTRWTSSAYNFEDHNKNIAGIIGDNVLKKFDNFDINTQLWAEVRLLKELNWYTKGGFRLQSDKSKDWRGQTTPVYNYHTGEVNGELDKGGIGLEEEDIRVFYYNFYTYLKYDYSLQHNNFSLLAGYNAENNKKQTLKAYRREYAFDLPTIGAGATSDWSNDGTEDEWAIMSWFGRLNYNYKEKYLFEANIRHDGTSRIASENRWGVFPSFSAGWRISEESFIKNMNLSWLDNAKIRGSWGQLGNQNITNYSYQSKLSKVTSYPFNKSDLTTAYRQAAYANRDLKWKTTTITDIGADLNLFRGLNIVFDWYYKNTTDILRQAQVSNLLGLDAPYINGGTLQNKGMELTVSWNDRIHHRTFKGLSYNVSAYIDRSRNQLKDFGAVEYGDYSIREDGLPYDEYFMLECIGVFATEEEIAKAPKQFNDNTRPGDLRYRDVDGNGVIDNNDRIPISGRFPNFEYAFNAGAQWKNFDLSLITQGVAGKKYYVSQWGVQPFLQGSAPTTDYIKGMWAEENPYGATHPRLYWGDLGGSKNTRNNTYFLQNVSYFRLKNITFGYTLPKHLTQKAYISKVRFYFSGDNLLTFTSFKGLDPEREKDGRAAQYPQNKIYSFAINVEF